jgi:hypothetical protein
VGYRVYLGVGALLLTLVSAVALSRAPVGPAGGGRTSSAAGFGLGQAREFLEFPLYNAGPLADGLPLVAVLRRNDTANYVSFVYGDCVPGDDLGCAPPAEIQVWPACRRNLALYEPAAPGIRPPERTTIRGVAAAVLEGETRLELETDRSTVVVFADSHARLLRIAAALRAVNGSVAPGELLPRPDSTPGRNGAAIDC